MKQWLLAVGCDSHEGTPLSNGCLLMIGPGSLLVAHGPDEHVAMTSWSTPPRSTHRRSSSVRSRSLASASSYADRAAAMGVSGGGP